MELNPKQDWSQTGERDGARGPLNIIELLQKHHSKNSDDVLIGTFRSGDVILRTALAQRPR